MTEALLAGILTCFWIKKNWSCMRNAVRMLNYTHGFIQFNLMHEEFCEDTEILPILELLGARIDLTTNQYHRYNWSSR